MLFVPPLTSVSFLAQVFNETMICQFLSNGAFFIFFLFFLWKCNVYNIFTTNSKWKVVISRQKSNSCGGLKLKLVTTYHLRFVVKVS